MSGQLQLRRGTTAQNNAFTGAVGELTYNTDDGSLISHNGVTAGGYPGGGYLYAPGATVRNVKGKLQESVSLKDFGAVGNGVANDTVAVQNAELNRPIYAPAGTYLTTIATPLNLAGTQYGYGQIKTADNNKSAPNFSIATSVPTSFGNTDDLSTAFNGDLSRCQRPVGQLISGVATLGQPTTGYSYTPELTPYYTVLENSSGWNQSTSGNVGRTAATVYRTLVKQYGQGDAMCYNGSVFVLGAKAGATSFLANPAGALFTGEVIAGSNGIFCNPAEWNCTDDGYDVSGIGLVNTFNRDNNTGALNTVWIGYRAQSIGSKPVDSFLSAAGLFNNGLDLVKADFGANQSAVSLKASQRIYFNNTATPTGGSGIDWVTNNYGGEYLAYSSSAGQTQFFGQSTVQFAVARAASAVNYVTASGAIASAMPSLTATGSDTNIDIKLNAKGTGVVDLGTQTAATAGALFGYMAVKISGTSYKIPLYAV